VVRFNFATLASLVSFTTATILTCSLAAAHSLVRDGVCNECEELGNSGNVLGPGGAFITWAVTPLEGVECLPVWSLCFPLGTGCTFSYTFSWNSGDYGDTVSAISTTNLESNGSVVSRSRVDATVGANAAGGQTDSIEVACGYLKKYTVLLTFTGNYSAITGTAVAQCVHCTQD
jgi:hypothetical protein